MDGTQHNTLRPCFSDKQIAALKDTGGSIISHRIGGGGGGYFAPVSVRELRFRTGSSIDALLLNGVQHGGNGGGVSDSIRLTLNKQIQDIGYAMNDGVLGSLTFYFTDGTISSFGVSRQETRLSTELNCDPEDLRIIALGGWSGNMLDALDPVCVVGFSEAAILDDDATAVIGAVPPGISRTEYVENTARQVESYENSLTQSHSVSANASVSGTYYVTASVETEYSYSWVSQTSLARSFEEQLTKATTEQITPPDGAYAMFEVTHGQIIAPYGDPSQSIFLPMGNVSSHYVPITDDTAPNFAGMYDLNGYANLVPPTVLKDSEDAATGLSKFILP